MLDIYPGDYPFTRWRSPLTREELWPTPPEIAKHVYTIGTYLQEANNFKFLGTTAYTDGCSYTDIHINISATTTTMAKLNRIWQSKIDQPVQSVTHSPHRKSNP